MRFQLTIELGNDAMQDYADIRQALGNGSNTPGWVRSFQSGSPVVGDEGDIRDSNGNTVGKWEVTETEARPDLPALKRANLLLHDMWGMLEYETRANRPPGYGGIERKFREHLQA